MTVDILDSNPFEDDIRTGDSFYREELVRQLGGLIYQKTAEEIIEIMRKFEEYVKHG